MAEEMARSSNSHFEAFITKIRPILRQLRHPVRRRSVAIPLDYAQGITQPLLPERESVKVY